MSLLDRISHDRDRELLETSEQQIQAERLQQAQVSQLKEIVRDALGKFARTLEEELTEIIPGAVYQVGDIVLLVELFEKARTLPDPGQPSFAVLEYLVWLLGVDKRSNRLDRRRLGTLKFLDYDGLYKEVVQAPTYLNLQATAVLEHTAELSRYL